MVTSYNVGVVLRHPFVLCLKPTTFVGIFGNPSLDFCKTSIFKINQDSTCKRACLTPTILERLSWKTPHRFHWTGRTRGAMFWVTHRVRWNLESRRMHDLPKVMRTKTPCSKTMPMSSLRLIGLKDWKHIDRARSHLIRIAMFYQVHPFLIRRRKTMRSVQLDMILILMTNFQH